MTQQPNSNGTLDERLYALQDANYNMTAIANAAGAVVQRFAYDAYGRPEVLDAGWASAADGYDWEVRYAGYRYDAATGLYQVRFRYYHPGLGRWVSRDPLGYVDGMSLYEYVKSAAIRWRDPFGLCTCDELKDLRQQHEKALQDVDWQERWREVTDNWGRYLADTRPTSGRDRDAARQWMQQRWQWEKDMFDADQELNRRRKHARGLEQQIRDCLQQMRGGQFADQMRVAAAAVVWAYVDNIVARASTTGAIGIANVAAQVGATVGEISLLPFRPFIGELKDVSLWGLVQEPFNDLYYDTWTSDPIWPMIFDYDDCCDD